MQIDDRKELNNIMQMYGIPNVALFDIFTFVFNLYSLLLYIFLFEFNLCSFLSYIFRFQSILDHLYSTAVHFYCMFRSYSIFDNLYLIIHDLYGIVIHYYSMTSIYIQNFSFVFFITIFI